MASSTPEIELIAQSSDIGGSENFPQGCSFSPDGLCVLTTSVADSKLRLYNTLAQTEARNVQEWKTSLVADGGQTVRSYSWYPHMKSSDPATSCFLASARYVSRREDSAKRWNAALINAFLITGTSRSICTMPIREPYVLLTDHSIASMKSNLHQSRRSTLLAIR